MPRLPRRPGLRARRDAGPPAPFVVGVGRSGTTLLRLMLDAHPELAIPPETHFVPSVIGLCRQGADVSRLAAEIATSRHFGDFGMERAQLEAAIAAAQPLRADRVIRVFFRLYADQQGKPRWGDKTPGYVNRMALIRSALPEARFIHLIRDGRDVVLSRRRRGMGAEATIERAARRWNDRVLAARRQGARLRGLYLELRYEDVVAEPEAALRRICDHIELPYDPVMLSYHRVAEDRLAELGDLPGEGGRGSRPAAERREAHALTTRAPSEERSGAWRDEMSEADRAAFARVAGDLLRELGYEG